VRRNLALLEYVRRSEYLSYSTAFPFNELAVLLVAGGRQPAAEGCSTRRAGMPLRGSGRRPARRIRPSSPASTSLRFKKTLLFNALASLPRTAAAGSGHDALIRLCAGLRHWVGLTLLPRIVAEACDVLEAGGDDVRETLDALEARFRAEAAVLHELEHKLRDALAPAGPSEPRSFDGAQCSVLGSVPSPPAAQPVAGSEAAG
jgi:hypothetical protein